MMQLLCEEGTSYEDTDTSTSRRAHVGGQEGSVLLLRGRSHRHHRQPVSHRFLCPAGQPPRDGISLGSANDLVGSLGTAFMTPVALALSAWLPDRLLSRITLLVGLPAPAVLTVGGPLLVFGVMPFNVQAPIMVAAWMVLCLWLFLVNRWLLRSGGLGPPVARLGEFLVQRCSPGLRSSGWVSCCPGCRGCS